MYIAVCVCGAQKVALALNRWSAESLCTDQESFPGNDGVATPSRCDMLPASGQGNWI